MSEAETVAGAAQKSEQPLDPSWTNLLRSRQTLHVSATLTSNALVYDGCTNAACNPYAEVRTNVTTCVSPPCKQGHGSETSCTNNTGSCGGSNVCDPGLVAYTNLDCDQNKAGSKELYAKGTRTAFEWGKHGFCEVAHSFPGMVYEAYTCRISCTLHKYCRGPVDLEKTCSLGRYALAWTRKRPNSATIPDEVKDLQLVPIPSYPDWLAAGVVNCDWSLENFIMNYSFSKTASVALWSSAISGGSNIATKAPAGPGDLQTLHSHFTEANRDSAVLWCAATHVYQSLYTISPNNVFSGIVNYLDDSELIAWVSTQTLAVGVQFLSQYQTSSASNYDKVTKLVADTLRAPRAFEKDGEYYMDLYLSESLLEGVLSGTHLPIVSEVQALVTTFFQDNKGLVGENSQPGNIPAHSCIIELSQTFKTLFATPVILTGEKAYTLLDEVGMLPGNINVPSSHFPEDVEIFILHYKLTVKIVQWSPMSLCYFAAQLPSFSMDTAQCTFLQTQVLPSVCYKGTPAEKVSIEKRVCGTRYIPPPMISGSLVNSFLVYANDGEQNICSCYNAQLGPGREPNETVSRCFASSCDDNIHISGYDITAAGCANTCGRMLSWLTSSDPAKRSQSLDDFSWDRFNTVCGNRYITINRETFNWKLGVGLSVTSVLLATAVGLAITTKNKLGAANISAAIVLSVFIGSVLLTLALVAAWFLTGVARCEANRNHYPSTSACFSRVLGTKLPQMFCGGPGATVNCECGSNPDCGNGGACQTGFCVDGRGTRPLQHLKATVIDPDYLIPFALTTIILPLILYLVLPTTIGKNDATRWTVVLLPSLLVFGLGMGLAVQQRAYSTIGGKDIREMNSPTSVTVMEKNSDKSVDAPTVSPLRDQTMQPEQAVGLFGENLKNFSKAVKEAYPQRLTFSILKGWITTEDEVSYYVAKIDSPEIKTNGDTVVCTQEDGKFVTCVWGDASFDVSKVPCRELQQ
jgi:hypothetical protein